MAAAPTIDAGVCERLINSALDRCTPVPQALPTQPAPVPVSPNFDALAASFGSLSAALAWGSVALAVVALLAIAGWGYLVKIWAEREARTEAKKCAKEFVDEHMKHWLASEAPQIVRVHVEYIMDASLGDKDDGEAAEEMGKEAG